MTYWGQITKMYYKTVTIHSTQLDKAHLTKWKEHTIHITFINFSWPRIKKDITAIKVIGTALNKPNLPNFYEVDMDTYQLSMF